MTPSNDLQRFVLRWHYGTVAVLGIPLAVMVFGRLL